MENDRIPIIKRLFADIADVINFYIKHDDLSPNETFTILIGFLSETLDTNVDEKEHMIFIVDEIAQKIKDNWRK